MMPSFTPAQWALAALGSLCIGLGKGGFSGIGLVTVIVFARLFPPLQSTGVVLPLLICGDLCAVAAYRQHANWKQIWRMLPPAALGIVIGFFLMQHIPGSRFGPVIGWIILIMVLLQTLRKVRPATFEHVPHTRRFAWGMGIWTGITTMLANAAGPVMTLYFLAVDLPKLTFVGTSAWFFLIINVFKVPFSTALGLIHGSSLFLNLILAPFVVAGLLIGRKLIAVIPQRLFEWVTLIFAGLSALRLIDPFF